MGFIIRKKQVNEWISKDSENKEVLKYSMVGKGLAKNPFGKPKLDGL
jgi:hypothetical protein